LLLRGWSSRTELRPSHGKIRSFLPLPLFPCSQLQLHGSPMQVQGSQLQVHGSLSLLQDDSPRPGGPTP
jgi:hypothetical protein